MHCVCVLWQSWVGAHGTAGEHEHGLTLSYYVINLDYMVCLLSTPASASE
jgi:hypothetical protein